jgi:hypothetical protein
VKLTLVENLAPDGSLDDADAAVGLAVTLPERSGPTIAHETPRVQEASMTIQEIHEVRERRQPARPGGGPAVTILMGGLCGLAWAAGLRGFMAQVAGSESGVDWAGTFGWILVPGILVGGLLGWAEHLRRSGGRRGWRWLALAPLLFSAILFSRPLDLLSIFEDGVGGGAIGVSLYGLLGGYAVSGRGPRWARIASGAVALTAIPIWALTVTSFAGPGLALDTPRGAWVAVYYWSFLAVLALACAIPHRAVTAHDAS